MYKEKVLITSNDVDCHLDLKLSSIFKFIQQVSTNHSEKLKIGIHETLDQNMCWVISRMQVNIYDYPKINDEVVVSTHPGEINHFVFPRFYQIYDKKGKLLVSASSTWVVIDIEKRTILLRPFGDRKFAFETSKDDIALPEKIEEIEGSKIEKRPIRYSDIDLNGHLNNTKYIEYIIDTKDKEFYDKHQISSILVNYKKELKCGDIVELSVKDFTDKSIVVGQIEDKDYFSALVAYKNR